MKTKNYLFVFCACMMVCLVGCTSTKVTRVNVNKRIDLTGEWNDYDASLVSQEMIRDSLEHPWLMNFVKVNGREPFVIVGHVANHSYEHINTQVFIKYLERALINSGKIILVASAEEREQIRQERQQQQGGMTEMESMAAVGKERGADFMLIGSVNSVKDEERRKAVFFYQVNLELIDLSTNVKVWIGQKEIKKFIERSKFSL